MSIAASLVAPHLPADLSPEDRATALEAIERIPVTDLMLMMNDAMSIQADFESGRLDVGRAKLAKYEQMAKDLGLGDLFASQLGHLQGK